MSQEEMIPTQEETTQDLNPLPAEDMEESTVFADLLDEVNRTVMGGDFRPDVKPLEGMTRGFRIVS